MDLPKMEISIAPNFQHVTWVVENFFGLPQENDLFLDSPEFSFSGDSYCLRLYPKVNRRNEARTEFHIRRLSVNFPKRKVSCKVGFSWREQGGDECHDYQPLSLEENISCLRCSIEKGGYAHVPNGSFTVVCSMRLSEESRAGSSASGTAQGEEQEGFPGHNASFSSQWSPTKMQLSTEFPCTYVKWSVPNFFELPRKVSDSLISPEFHFGGDTYCLRFHPKRDMSDSDLQIVRLTSTYPERTVFYRVGYGSFTMPVYPRNSRSLVYKIGFCISRSELEKESDDYAYDGTLGLVLFLCLGEQSSARASVSAGQMWSGLPDIDRLQSDYRQLLQKETESDACIIVCGKEFRAHRVVLRARSTIFESMFAHDTAEKESGRVVIDDLDEESFGDFLEYLYTGDIQAGLSDDNAFRLYAAADKYEVSTLKSKCMEHMRRTLSVDTFCDFLTLALHHLEEDLLQQAISFFLKNIQSIIITMKWQQFVCDNPTTANELFIKAIVPGKQ